MTNLKIGVLISNNRNQVVGYSLEKGFFNCKELFFDEEFYKNNLNDETLWFTNIKKENIKQSNIKSNDFFAIKISDIMIHHGLNNVNINFKIILKKIHDIVLILSKNYIDSFKRNDIEKVNPKVGQLREEKRILKLLKHPSYASLLLDLKNEYKANVITSVIKSENKTYNLIPNRFYNINSYKEKTNNEIKNALTSMNLSPELQVVQSRKSFFVTINTLNINNFNKIEYQDFYNIEEYKMLNFNYNEVIDQKKENIKEILYFKNCLFYLIEIIDTPNKRIFQQMKEQKFWISKKELEFYLLNNFKFKMIYVIEVDPLNKKPKFNFNSLLLNEVVTTDVKRSVFSESIHLLNYLEILKLSKNKLFDTWLESNLKSLNLNIVSILENKGFEIVGYDSRKIVISYNSAEKENLISTLIDNNIKPPQKLL